MSDTTDDGDVMPGLVTEDEVDTNIPPIEVIVMADDSPPLRPIDTVMTDSGQESHDEFHAAFDPDLPTSGFGDHPNNIEALLNIAADDSSDIMESSEDSEARRPAQATTTVGVNFRHEADDAAPARNSLPETNSADTEEPLIRLADVAEPARNDVPETNTAGTNEPPRTYGLDELLRRHNLPNLDGMFTVRADRADRDDHVAPARNVIPSTGVTSRAGPEGFGTSRFGAGEPLHRSVMNDDGRPRSGSTTWGGLFGRNQRPDGSSAQSTNWGAVAAGTHPEARRTAPSRESRELWVGDRLYHPREQFLRPANATDPWASRENTPPEHAPPRDEMVRLYALFQERHGLPLRWETGVSFYSTLPTATPRSTDTWSDSSLRAMALMNAEQIMMSRLHQTATTVGIGGGLRTYTLEIPASPDDNPEAHTATDNMASNPSLRDRAAFALPTDHAQAATFARYVEFYTAELDAVRSRLATPPASEVAREAALTQIVEDFNGTVVEDTVCQICLGTFHSGECENPSTINHERCTCRPQSRVYGSECIRLWLRDEKTCPVCRNIVRRSFERPSRDELLRTDWERYFLTSGILDTGSGRGTRQSNPGASNTSDIPPYPNYSPSSPMYSPSSPMYSPPSPPGRPAQVLATTENVTRGQDTNVETPSQTTPGEMGSDEVQASSPFRMPGSFALQLAAAPSAAVRLAQQSSLLDSTIREDFESHHDIIFTFDPEPESTRVADTVAGELRRDSLSFQAFRAQILRVRDIAERVTPPAAPVTPSGLSQTARGTGRGVAGSRPRVSAPRPAGWMRVLPDTYGPEREQRLQQTPDPGAGAHAYRNQIAEVDQALERNTRRRHLDDMGDDYRIHFEQLRVREIEQLRADLALQASFTHGDINASIDGIEELDSQIEHRRRTIESISARLREIAEMNANGVPFSEQLESFEGRAARIAATYPFQPYHQPENVEFVPIPTNEVRNTQREHEYDMASQYRNHLEQLQVRENVQLVADLALQAALNHTDPHQANAYQAAAIEQINSQVEHRRRTITSIEGRLRSIAEMDANLIPIPAAEQRESFEGRAARIAYTYPFQLYHRPANTESGNQTNDVQTPQAAERGGDATSQEVEPQNDELDPERVAEPIPYGIRLRNLLNNADRIFGGDMALQPRLHEAGAHEGVAQEAGADRPEISLFELREIGREVERRRHILADMDEHFETLTTNMGVGGDAEPSNFSGDDGMGDFSDDEEVDVL